MKQLTLGHQPFLFLKRNVSISSENAKTHWHVIGVSGSGKSRYLAHLYLALRSLGMSATLVDPHGDLSHLILGHLVASGVFNTPEGFEKVLFLDLPEAERRGLAVPLNILKQFTPTRAILPHIVSANILQAFHRAYPELAEGAAAFNNLVKYGTQILISNDLPLTLLGHFLTNPSFRQSLYAQEEDYVKVQYFTDFFDPMPQRLQAEEIDSAMRRIGDLTHDPFLRYSLSASQNLLNFRQVFDEGRSVIINLAVEDTQTQRLLGCLLTVMAEQAAKSRADTPESERNTLPSHHLLIDEFHLFSSQSERALSAMLSQCRKFSLFAILAHQTWDQASEHLKGALQNVRIEVILEQGYYDAAYSAPILTSFDPARVKHVVEDEGAASRTHPVFSSVQEQKEGMIDALRDLVPGQAYLHLNLAQQKKRKRRVVRVTTPIVPNPQVSEDAVREVREEYLRRYFLPQSKIDRELQLHRRVEELSATPGRVRRQDVVRRT